jgi:hypothetical protein
VVALSCWARLKISSTPSAYTSDESFKTMDASLDHGGMASRTACGMMMKRIASIRLMPMARAAVICPPPTAVNAPRRISI